MPVLQAAPEYVWDDERGQRANANAARDFQATPVRILIVDDDPHIRDLLVFALGKAGMTTAQASDGEDARAALIDALDLFGIGYSWGGYESLALPVDPARHRTATRWDAGPLVRLSIGLEDPADLIADLDRGFAAYRAALA